MSLAELRALPAHRASAEQRDALMLPAINALSLHHHAACEPYRRIIDGIWGGAAALGVDALQRVPFLPVGLFKQQWLASVADERVTVTLTSSGTTGQDVSRIAVDADTSIEQQLCLADSMASVLGPKRLPMLVLDTAAVLRDPALLSARGAGVLGMMRFGYRPVFVLDEHGEPDKAAVQRFLAERRSGPFFLFGFTYLVWTALYQRFAALGLDLSEGTLVHSGGWKTLIEQSVDNETFRAELKRAFGIERVFNFYGMVEQIGSVFIEGQSGLLHPPNFTQVLIRDPRSWEPVPAGTPGLIQVLSLIPRSYPGHSLLTEDLGVIEIGTHGDSAGRVGLRVLGRLPKAELRGCSDVIAAAA